LYLSYKQLIGVAACCMCFACLPMASSLWAATQEVEHEQMNATEEQPETNATTTQADAEEETPMLQGGACFVLEDDCPDLSLPEHIRNPFLTVNDVPLMTSLQNGSLNVRFDGTEVAYGQTSSVKNMPRLRVVGLLDNGKTISVLAELEERGRVILRPNEQVFVAEGKKGGGDAVWFTVKEITHNTMTLILKDGMVVHGNFF